MTILTLRDGLKAGLCVSGQKRFFQTHGLDFAEYVRNGLDVESLSHIEDVNLQRAIAVATEREGQDGRRR